MKENQNEFFDSKSFGRETDALMFESKETHELNDPKMDASPMGFEAKHRDDTLSCKVVDEFSMDNGNGTIDFPAKEGQIGLPHHLSSWDKDADSLSSDSYDIDKEQRSLEHESSVTADEFADCNGSDFRDSSSPCNGASDSFEADISLFTDKNVLECEVPELKVCDKEIDCQNLKDICIDEGRAEKDINMIESCKDQKPAHLSTQPHNENKYFEATEDLSPEYANGLGANQCGNNEENDDKKLVSEGMLESSLDNSFQKDTAKHCDPDDFLRTGEGNCGLTGKAETDSSEVETLVNRKHPTEDFGEGNETTQPPDQIPNGKAASESPATTSAEAGGEDVQAASVLYNSKVESGSITFNFNSPVPVIVGNGITEDIHKQSADSGDAKDVNSENLADSLEVQCTSNNIGNVQELQSADLADAQNDVNAENLSDSPKVQCTSSSIENVQEQSLVITDVNSDGGSATSCVQCVRSNDGCGENAREQSSEHKDANSDDFSTDGQGHFPSNKSGSFTNDVKAVEPNIPKHERKNSGNASVVSQLQHDEGETSFSAASLITYSGPIAFSGSLSHRSDGSTTSGKSFAFPILQNEWNSSPVRMAKADRRDFRKHKGWRSGLLCCRF